MKYKAFHKLSYGLYIVASAHEGNKSGYVANTVFQVTSTPPLLAISCNKDNFTCGVILKSKIFAVSVLKKESSTSLLGEFGFTTGKEVDKFRKVNYEIKITGAPIVRDSCIAWLDCRVTDTMDLGTHMLIIGEVADCDITSDEEPLTYAWYREKFRMLAPKNAPTYIEKSQLEAEERAHSVKIPDSGKPAAKTVLSEYYCTICGHHYNPEEGDPTVGIMPGTPFEDLPDDYRCPVCNAPKEYFREA